MRTVRKKGVRYGIAACLGLVPLVGCGVYWYVISHSIEVAAVTVVPYSIDAPPPHEVLSAASVPGVTVVRWRSSDVGPPYTVIRNGHEVTKTTNTYFVDPKPTRDAVPGIQRIVDVYRVSGWVWSLFPRTSTPTPPEDRISQATPCVHEGEPDLCIPTFDLNGLRAASFDEFRKPMKILAIVGHPKEVNVTAYFDEPEGAKVEITSDRDNKTRLYKPGAIVRKGDTFSFEQTFTEPGRYTISITNPKTRAHIATVPVVAITEEEVRVRAYLIDKLYSPSRPAIQ